MNTLLPIVAAAVVAGISALVKAFYERRDARQTTQRSLEMAIARRDFVKDWLALRSTVGGDVARVDDARVARELERSWTEACTALDRGQALLAEAQRATLGDQLRSLLLLERWRRPLSWLTVCVYYVFVVFSWIVVFGEDLPRSDPDYISKWELAIYATVLTILFRIVFGWAIHWYERRGRRSDAAPTDGPGDPVAPVASGF